MTLRHKIQLRGKKPKKMPTKKKSGKTPTKRSVLRVHHGDCREWIKKLPDNYADSCVTDPPYHLTQVSRGGSPRKIDLKTPYGRTRVGEKGFMGKTWDGGGVAFTVDLWREVLRVLKPGGHLLAFGGTRTCHRLACAIEDAGFEIRDRILWIFGSGFPKSRDVSKAIDSEAGKKRKVIGVDQNRAARLVNQKGKYVTEAGWSAGNRSADITDPVTPEAKQWVGWGTALKPACELVTVARKPLSEKTVAKNVLKHGTGAINIGGCRVEAEGRPLLVGDYKKTDSSVYSGRMDGSLKGGSKAAGKTNEGRWPANVILDEDAGKQLDKQSRVTKSRKGKPRKGKSGDGWGMTATGGEYADEGGASRFFYCAKAPKKERNEGLPKGMKNKHPTVKPVKLMAYLIRLVTQPGGIVLEPFAGSGTTCVAALREGMRFRACELEEDSVHIAQARIDAEGRKR